MARTNMLSQPHAAGSRHRPTPVLSSAEGPVLSPVEGGAAPANRRGAQPAMPGPPGTLRLQIHVQPRAARTRIVGRHGDAIKVQVHAPPAEGAANSAVIDLLAETLGVARRAVHIVRGRSSREKLVEIHADDPAACRQRLDALLQARLPQPPR